MKRSIALSLAILTCVACISIALARGKRTAPKYDVKGVVQTIHDYCGGARPSEEQSKPVPYPARNTTLYIKNNTTKRVVDSLVTDSAGNFSVKLTRGDYCIVEKWKAEPYVTPVDTKYEKWDTTCYRKRYLECDYFLSVRAAVNGVKITLHRQCAWSRPCVTYSGPMPPAAPPTNRSGNQPGHQE